MKFRAALVVALVAAGTLGASSIAATKSCNLITDPKGDSSFGVVSGAPGLPGTPSMDIVGGDIASNKDKVTAVIRVDKLTKCDPQGPFGQAWFFNFLPKGVSDADWLFLAAYTSPTGGDEFIAGYQGANTVLPLKVSYPLKSVTGTFDTAKNEIRITANLADFGKYASNVAKGKTFTTITAEARRLTGQRAVKSQLVGPVWVPVGGLTSLMDSGTATKTYTAGADSCVKVGA